MTDQAIKKIRRFARQRVADGNTVGVATEPAATVKRTTKTDGVVGLLERPEGATIAELVEATGWLPHTTRAALTGLKKKGMLITKGKRSDVTCYFIASCAA